MLTNAFMVPTNMLFKQMVQNKHNNKIILNPIVSHITKSYFHEKSSSKSGSTTTSRKWGEDDNNNERNVFVDDNGRTIRKSKSSNNSDEKGDGNSSSSNKWVNDNDYNDNNKGSTNYERTGDGGGGGNKWSTSNYDDGSRHKQPQQPKKRFSNNNNRRSNNNDNGSYGRREKRPSFGDRRGGGGGGDGRYNNNRSDNRNSYSNSNRFDDRNSNNNRNKQDNRNSYNNKNSNDNEDRNSYSRNDDPNRINIRSLEEAGLEHLYGLTPVLNALRSKRRTLEPPDDDDSISTWEEENNGIKLEAQSRPILFIQERNYSITGKVGDKAKFAKEIEILANEMNLPIARVDKGVLNALSSNRPHQGFVLRTYNLPYTQVDKLQEPNNNDNDNDASSPLLYLVLDEVVDPQNFGALLRSAYFLSGDNGKSIQVVTSSKNSAPPSPTVSAASSGAMEVMNVLSTTNLPKLLTRAKDDGWNIIGAASASAITNAVNDDNELENENTDSKFYINLKDVSVLEPTILVLGSEGFGLRTMVAKCCSGFVRIGNDDDDDDVGDNNNNAVDSLNVSVTGGIMMWHLINRIRR